MKWKIDSKECFFFLLIRSNTGREKSQENTDFYNFSDVHFIERYQAKEYTVVTTMSMV